MPVSATTKITITYLKQLEKDQQSLRVMDSDLKGFGVEVRANGGISFLIRYTMDGKRRFKTVGTWGRMTLDDARKKARAWLAGVDVGVLPGGTSQAAVTLAQVKEQYVEQRQARGQLKKSTIATMDSLMKNLEDWEDRPLVSISGDDVVARHAEIGENSRSNANGTMRHLRSFFNFAMEVYAREDGSPAITSNPVLRLSRLKLWFPKTRKDTLLKRDDLKPWFDAVQLLDKVPEREPGTGKHNPKLRHGAISRDYLLFLLLTGLRKNEGLLLTWDRVDLKGKTITIADTKAGRPHTLPLTPYLIEILHRRKDEGEGQFVFSSSKGERLQNLNHAINRVTDTCGVSFTLHDLRRTFITVAESLDIPAYALKKLLNHSLKSDVTAGYIIIDEERLREPMAKITDYFLKAAKGEAKEPGSKSV